jgi:hypothetical protein
VAIAAALGEGFARLYLADGEWLEHNLDDLFGGRVKYGAFQQSALSTALATHQPHPKLIALLRGPLVNAMQHFGEGSPVVGWPNVRSYERLSGDWIVNDHLRGNLAADDELVDTFFERATAEDRGGSVLHRHLSLVSAGTPVMSSSNRHRIPRERQGRGIGTCSTGLHAPGCIRRRSPAAGLTRSATMTTIENGALAANAAEKLHTVDELCEYLVVSKDFI